MREAETHAIRILAIYCKASAIAVVGVACLVLYGWALHIDSLMSVFPGLVTMKANTALGLAFCGISLWLLFPAQASARRRHITHFLAVLVVLIGVATLSEYFLGLDLQIDQILFNDPLGSHDRNRLCGPRSGPDGLGLEDPPRSLARAVAQSLGGGDFRDGHRRLH